MKMKRRYILSLILFLASDSSLAVEGESVGRLQGQSIGERSLIIGGASARRGEYPYFAHFETPGCGGALIAPDVVLTAGHCKLARTSNYGSVYIGEYSLRGNQDGAEAFTVVEDVRHPSFDDQVCCGRAGSDWYYGIQYDFLLLKLSGESSVSPVRLNKNSSLPHSGDEVTVIGFGDVDPGIDFLEPNILKEVTLNYLTNADCIAQSIYPSKLLNSASMCATDVNQDACAGDSGGPLLIKGATSTGDVMVGTVSWGWECGVYPGVYGRVSKAYWWIRREVCRLSANPPGRFNCPTIAPAPTPQPTARRTPYPTPRPTRLPTMPSTHQISQRGETPSVEKKLAPTEEPTISEKGHTDEAKEINAAEPTSSANINEGNHSYSAAYEKTNVTTKSIVRISLPEGKPCSVASTSPVVCCSSKSNSTDGTSGTQDCIPVRDVAGAGLSCKSSNWVQSNNPDMYDPSMCDLFPSTSSSEPSLLGDRQYLPLGTSCSDIKDHHECCLYLDNRVQQDSNYHGQPCVPLRSSNSNISVDLGVCQPANLVAERAPGVAMDCQKLQQNDDKIFVLSNSTDAWQVYLQKLLQEIKQEILWEQGERTIERIDLPSGESCDTIEDPMVCCAARSVDAGISQNCVPIKTAWLGKPIGNHRPERGITCRPIENDNMDDDAMSNSSVLDGVTISSTTPTTRSNMTSSSRSGTSSNTIMCDRMIRILQRRTRLSRLECSSLRSPRSCCSAVDRTGQPCMPIRLGKGEDPTCVSIEWVVSHHPNVTLLECSKIPSLYL